ncbi:hypothetical protein [Pseudonocardia nigra]|uniref:hypothetical protein n=1 Tax=Pseudonocardia nigra TaxID=1921578 RepID=UPI001C5F6C2E|nr:hypothetical protein [Pseudonocardia nigra]
MAYAPDGGGGVRRDRRAVRWAGENRRQALITGGRSRVDLGPPPSARDRGLQRVTGMQELITGAVRPARCPLIVVTWLVVLDGANAAISRRSLLR